MNDQLALIRRLTRERDEAREEVTRLLKAFGGDEWTPPAALQLTPTERLIVCALVKRRGELTYVQFHLLLNSGRPACDETGEKLPQVFIMKIRRKFAPFGLSIETIWGIGYLMPEATRQQLLAMSAATIPEPLMQASGAGP